MVIIPQTGKGFHEVGVGENGIKRISGGVLTMVAPQVGNPSFREVHPDVLFVVVVSRSCTGMVSPPVSRWRQRDFEAAQEGSWPKFQWEWDCKEDARGASSETSAEGDVDKAPKGEQK